MSISVVELSNDGVLNQRVASRVNRTSALCYAYFFKGNDDGTI